ncbi:uncharacterized protein LOC113465057 [Ceratina calcarata]|uniref:Uncharacterized protein LOC113465057 n=1 Tax=Ceratina calcarata TaxID=156304 RepID=A0AAJ7SB41_9HYME|nr:uncharacterized protein LOC113465057 [Ceratina calcarata]
MDVSKTRPKYKQYTCLCFSVMGQRRFRVSMGVLIATPEAGDASVNVVPQMKKNTSKNFVAAIPERNDGFTACNHGNDSFDSINKDAYDHLLLMKNSSFDTMSNSSIHDSCLFPYYRSNKSDSNSDAVLVKDVGVSCTLLNIPWPEDFSRSLFPQSKNLVKHLKEEYDDLSNITHKITAYTKDILGQLSKRDERKQQLLKDLTGTNHAAASQYVDGGGNLCLKLRFLSNAGTQCEKDLLSNRNDTKRLRNKHSRNQMIDKTDLLCDEHILSKYEKYVQTIINQTSAGTNTSTSSNTSLYNFLTMRKRRMADVLTNTKSTRFSEKCPKYSSRKSSKSTLNKQNSVVLTNWSEISKKQGKHNKLSIGSKESQQMANAKNKKIQDDYIKKMNNLPNTKFHTVNIRVVKQKNTRKKHV